MMSDKPTEEYDLGDDMPADALGPPTMDCIVRAIPMLLEPYGPILKIPDDRLEIGEWYYVRIWKGDKP